MYIYSAIAICLLTIAFAMAPLIGIPKLAGKERTIEIPHLMLAFILAFSPLKDTTLLILN